MVPLWLEVLLIAISYCMTVGFLLLSVVARGSRWMYGNNALLRKRWTKRMLSREADSLALLGVQTYRNVIMSSSFLATAVLGVSSFFLSSVFSKDEVIPPRKQQTQWTTALARAVQYSSFFERACLK